MRAANVVNATGVWADQLRPQELHDEAELPRIRPSRGTHVTLRHEELPLVGGAIVPAGAGRSIFALPWLGHTLVGTTDNDYEGPLDHVAPSSEDVDYLLDAVNEFFGTDLGPAQLTGAFAGVRPLISTGDPKKSVDISRKAELYETSSGMITITGGKLTTWRRMAKMTVDRLVERDARDAPCRTQEIPLGQAIAVEELPRVEGVAEESYAALAARYGYAAHDVLALGRRARRAGPADRRRPARPARRGRARRAPRAGAQHRRRAAAAHAPRAARRARAPAPGAGRQPVRGRAPARRRRARARARLGRSARLGSSWSASREEARAEGIGRAVPAGGAGRVRRARARRAPRPRFERARRARSRACELRRSSSATRPWLMGIVNASPGLLQRRRHRTPTSTPAGARRASCSATGADVIDVGGESATTGRRRWTWTRRSSAWCRWSSGVAGELGALVSVDTYKPQVAARRDRGRRAHRQRRQRPARPRPRRRLRRDAARRWW